MSSLIVKDLFLEDLFNDPCGAQRLPNGNIIILNYDERMKDGIKLFEVTPDKKVVWIFTHPKVAAHGVHVMRTNGRPIEHAWK